MQDTQMIKVATIATDSYDQQVIDSATAQLLDQLGGIENIVPQGAKVFIKANLVRDMHPDRAGTTHPTVLCALSNIIADKCNATVTVGDSSGGLYTAEYMGAVYRRCNMTYVTANSSAVLNSDYGSSTVDIGGKVLYNTSIIDAFINADVVINVGKLKMHSFTGYSGAVKNLYGLVAGLVKVELHSRFGDLDSFANCLIDIEQYASSKIVLHVLDAVIGMEGAGPTNGTPVKIGQLMASTDPYLLDYVANCLYCNPSSQPILNKAIERGVLDASLCNLDFDLQKWHNNFLPNFKVVTVMDNSTFLNAPAWLRKLVRNKLTQKVAIRRKKCRACSKCVNHCPEQAITITGNVAVVDQSKCIRCYCCQELCPFDAVALKKSLLYRVARGMSGKKSSKPTNQKQHK